MNCPHCGQDITAQIPLTTAQRQVLRHLDGWLWQSSGMIADKAGYSAGYTRTILRQLETLEVVKRRRRHGGYLLALDKLALIA